MMAVDLQSKDSLWRSSHEDNKNIQNWSFCISNLSDFGSTFSSPVESELGSTESDSDQADDYIAELTRQMAHYMLQDDEDNNNNIRPQNKGCSQEESNVEKNEGNLPEQDSVSLPISKPQTPNLELKSRQALIDYQIRTIQLNKLKQDQIMKQKEVLLLSAYKKSEANNEQKTWANIVQQKQRTGSEMTAVFLGETGPRSGSGTGVFLPRGINNNTCESRKKQGCSTVLIPARVVQALKVHIDKMGMESRFPAQLQQHDGIMEDLWYSLQIKKKNQSKNVKNKEIGLPQEWTY